MTKSRGYREYRTLEHSAGGADINNADVQWYIFLAHANGKNRNLAVAELLRSDQGIDIAVVGAVADQHHAAQRQAVQLIRDSFQRLADRGPGAELAKIAVLADTPCALIKAESSELEGLRQLFDNRAIQELGGGRFEAVRPPSASAIIMLRELSSTMAR